jgi:hypothetical protein
MLLSFCLYSPAITRLGLARQPGLQSCWDRLLDRGLWERVERIWTENELWNV